jgi:two-component system, LytTR family, sensor histidine kinase AlgZ
VNKTEMKFARNNGPGNFFLPDLCNVHALLFLVIGTETGALIFAIIYSGLKQFSWDYFALTSFFMLWIVLASAFFLCLIRRLNLNLSLKGQGILAYLVVILNTTVLAIVTDLVFRQQDLQQWDAWFIIETVLISTVLTGLILRYFYLQHLWQLQQQAELVSRVDALQARIRPHFLFNSMNSIVGLIHEDSEAAEEAVIDLAELFRATLKDASHLVPVQQELALCKRYLRIEKLRLGERLVIEWQINNLSQEAMVPQLSIQPLVENAIYHGIQPTAAGGTLVLDVREQESFLYVMISNPLPSPGYEKTHQGNRMAMVNIKSRLQAFFGERAVLKSSQVNDRYITTLRIPLQKK